jgi:N-acetylneuraminic acid mutarotase
MERIRITILGLLGLATVWLFLSLSLDSQNPAAAAGRFADLDSWHAKAKMPDPRKFEAAFPIDGKIYCVTSGDDTGKDGGRVYTYSPANDTWTKKRAVNIARHSSGFGLLDGRIYSISGVLEEHQSACRPSLTGAVEEYNPATDTWRQRASLPRPRLFTIGAAANGKFYAIGGVAQPDARMFDSRFVDEYDPKTDRWTPKADLPLETRAYRVTVVNDRIYLIGGADRNFSRLLAGVYEYDPVSDSWIPRASMPTPRADCAVTAMNGKIYVFGGLGGMNATEEYDPALNQWRTCSCMPTANWLQVAAPLQGRIYVISGWEGGWPGGNVLNTVWEYRPAG